MLHSFATWALHSPRRLIAVAVPIAVAAVGVPLVVAQNGSAEPAASSATSSPRLADEDDLNLSQSHSRSPEANERSASPKVLRSAAQAFLRLYLVPPDEHPASIPTKLRRVVTRTLWAGLKHTDPQSLPAGPVTEMDVESAGPFSGILVADLASDKTLTIRVVRWSHGWRVSDVRPEQTQ